MTEKATRYLLLFLLADHPSVFIHLAGPGIYPDSPAARPW